ncbi:hypothetical protein DTO271G3_2742 [Paecilomyces variotii]|nr:hypothetical protein DTO271G3_2742 [Paecilomyces variotii]
MAAPGSVVLNNFLRSIAELTNERDGAKLQDFLQLEPPLPEIYQKMAMELRQYYPANTQGDAELLKRCEALVPRTRSGPPWTAFPVFMKLYFTFLRDANVENLLETYDMLKGLLNQCVLALGDSQMGVIVLPTVLYLSKVLSKLAMGLDRRPELVAHLLRQEGRLDREEATEKVTLVEQSANVVREAFIKCLTDRSGTPGTQGKPEGRRVGIYLMANVCLKLLFQCGKLRNAEQMFASISAQSPPLEYFPASQRVTYLYYLGRYLFSNNLFYPAQTALQAAYDQCHRQAMSQKNLILTYLIPCNIVLGRFPSAALLQKPEAQGLADKFVPLCRLILSGDYIAFRQYLAFDSPELQWFARKGILLQLRNRCEILVWRSLTRKVFIHGGFHGDARAQAQRGPPPFLYLNKLETVVRWLQARHERPGMEAIGTTSLFGAVKRPDLAKDAAAQESEYGSQVVYHPPDNDFSGLGDNPTQAAETTHHTDFDDYAAPDGFFDAQGEWQENPAGALVDGEPNDDYDQYELNPYPSGNESQNRDQLLMAELESILASLLTQGLMRGYLTHKNPRFAIPGARLKGALPTGFPNVWQTISARESEDDSVPGWVRKPAQPAFQPKANTFDGAGGGRVVNLSGARPVGVQ